MYKGKHWTCQSVKINVAYLHDFQTLEPCTALHMIQQCQGYFILTCLHRFRWKSTITYIHKLS